MFVFGKRIKILFAIFLSFSWWDAILDLLALSIGYCAIKEENQYEVSVIIPRIVKD